MRTRSTPPFSVNTTTGRCLIVVEPDPVLISLLRLAYARVNAESKNGVVSQKLVLQRLLIVGAKEFERRLTKAQRSALAELKKECGIN